jgi:glycosyltransferase involved in cell wall biosynthesis
MTIPHIAIVHDKIEAPSGMGRVAEWMARCVLERGWRLTLVAATVTPDIAADASIVTVRSSARLPSLVEHLAWCARAARVLGGVHADVIHVHAPALLRVADLMTCHYLAAAGHAAGERESRAGVEGMLRRGQALLERRIDDSLYRRRPRSTELSFVSEFLRDQFRSRYGEPKGGRVIPQPAPGWNPVSTAEQQAARRGWGIAPDAFVVGFLGGNAARKGVDDVLLLAHEPMTLLIGGPGSESLRWSGGHGHGFVEPDTIIAACDVLVAPSVFDSGPLVVLQALARGVRVVVRPASGYAAAVQRHGAGAVWNAGESLASAVRRAAAGTRESCQAVVEEFSEERARGELLAAHQSLLARDAGGLDGERHARR